MISTLIADIEAVVLPLLAAVEVDILGCPNFPKLKQSEGN
jgi:hypothetical protein